MLFATGRTTQWVHIFLAPPVIHFKMVMIQESNCGQLLHQKNINRHISLTFKIKLAHVHINDINSPIK